MCPVNWWTRTIYSEETAGGQAVPGAFAALSTCARQNGLWFCKVLDDPTLERVLGAIVQGKKQCGGDPKEWPDAGLPGAGETYETPESLLLAEFDVEDLGSFFLSDGKSLTTDGTDGAWAAEGFVVPDRKDALGLYKTEELSTAGRSERNRRIGEYAAWGVAIGAGVGVIGALGAAAGSGGIGFLAAGGIIAGTAAVGGYIGGAIGAMSCLWNDCEDPCLETFETYLDDSYKSRGVAQGFAAVLSLAAPLDDTFLQQADLAVQASNVSRHVFLGRVDAIANLSVQAIELMAGVTALIGGELSHAVDAQNVALLDMNGKVRELERDIIEDSRAMFGELDNARQLLQGATELSANQTEYIQRGLEFSQDSLRKTHETIRVVRRILENSDLAKTETMQLINAQRYGRTRYADHTQLLMSRLYSQFQDGHLPLVSRNRGRELPLWNWTVQDVAGTGGAVPKLAGQNDTWLTEQELDDLTFEFGRIPRRERAKVVVVSTVHTHFIESTLAPGEDFASLAVPGDDWFHYNHVELTLACDPVTIGNLYVDGLTPTLLRSLIGPAACVLGSSSAPLRCRGCRVQVHHHQCDVDPARFDTLQNASEFLSSAAGEDLARAVSTQRLDYGDSTRAGVTQNESVYFDTICLGNVSAGSLRRIFHEEENIHPIFTLEELFPPGTDFNGTGNETIRATDTGSLLALHTWISETLCDPNQAFEGVGALRSDANQSLFANETNASLIPFFVNASNVTQIYRSSHLRLRDTPGTAGAVSSSILVQDLQTLENGTAESQQLSTVACATSRTLQDLFFVRSPGTFSLPAQIERYWMMGMDTLLASDGLQRQVWEQQGIQPLLGIRHTFTQRSTPPPPSEQDFESNAGAVPVDIPDATHSATGVPTNAPGTGAVDRAKDRMVENLLIGQPVATTDPVQAARINREHRVRDRTKCVSSTWAVVGPKVVPMYKITLAQVVPRFTVSMDLDAASTGVVPGERDPAVLARLQQLNAELSTRVWSNTDVDIEDLRSALAAGSDGVSSVWLGHLRCALDPRAECDTPGPFQADRRGLRNRTLEASHVYDTDLRDFGLGKSWVNARLKLNALALRVVRNLTADAQDRLLPSEPGEIIGPRHITRHILPLLGASAETGVNGTQQIIGNRTVVKGTAAWTSFTIEDVMEQYGMDLRHQHPTLAGVGYDPTLAFTPETFRTPVAHLRFPDLSGRGTNQTWLHAQCAKPSLAFRQTCRFLSLNRFVDLRSAAELEARRSLALRELQDERRVPGLLVSNATIATILPAEIDARAELLRQQASLHEGDGLLWFEAHRPGGVVSVTLPLPETDFVGYAQLHNECPTNFAVRWADTELARLTFDFPAGVLQDTPGGVRTLVMTLVPTPNATAVLLALGESVNASRCPLTRELVMTLVDPRPVMQGRPSVTGPGVHRSHSTSLGIDLSLSDEVRVELVDCGGRAAWSSLEIRDADTDRLCFAYELEEQATTFHPQSSHIEMSLVTIQNHVDINTIRIMNDLQDVARDLSGVVVAGAQQFGIVQRDPSRPGDGFCIDWEWLLTANANDTNRQRFPALLALFTATSQLTRTCINVTRTSLVPQPAVTKTFNASTNVTTIIDVPALIGNVSAWPGATAGTTTVDELMEDLNTTLDAFLRANFSLLTYTTTSTVTAQTIEEECDIEINTTEPAFATISCLGSRVPAQVQVVIAPNASSPTPTNDTVIFTGNATSQNVSAEWGNNFNDSFADREPTVVNSTANVTTLPNGTVSVESVQVRDVYDEAIVEEQLSAAEAAMVELEQQQAADAARVLAVIQRQAELQAAGDRLTAGIEARAAELEADTERVRLLLLRFEQIQNNTNVTDVFGFLGPDGWRCMGDAIGNIIDDPNFLVDKLSGQITAFRALQEKAAAVYVNDDINSGKLRANTCVGEEDSSSNTSAFEKMFGFANCWGKIGMPLFWISIGALLMGGIVVGIFGAATRCFSTTPQQSDLAKIPLQEGQQQRQVSEDIDLDESDDEKLQDSGEESLSEMEEDTGLEPTSSKASRRLPHYL